MSNSYLKELLLLNLCYTYRSFIMPMGSIMTQSKVTSQGVWAYPLLVKPCPFLSIFERELLALSVVALLGLLLGKQLFQSPCLMQPQLALLEMLWDRDVVMHKDGLLVNIFTLIDRCSITLPEIIKTKYINVSEIDSKVFFDSSNEIIKNVKTLLGFHMHTHQSFSPLEY